MSASTNLAERILGMLHHGVPQRQVMHLNIHDFMARLSKRLNETDDTDIQLTILSETRQTFRLAIQQVNVELGSTVFNEQAFDTTLDRYCPGILDDTKPLIKFIFK